MIRALLLCVLLAGCTFFDAPRPVLERTASIINVKIDPTLPTLGRAAWTGDTCFIALREYPKRLQHEMRHCLEGKWHGDEPSGEDCQ